MVERDYNYFMEETIRISVVIALVILICKYIHENENISSLTQSLNKCTMPSQFKVYVVCIRITSEVVWNTYATSLYFWTMSNYCCWIYGNQNGHAVNGWHRTTPSCPGRTLLSGRPHNKSLCLPVSAGDVQPHAIASGAAVRTVRTLVPLLARVRVHVLLKVIGLDAGVRTQATLQGSLTRVNHEVLTQVVGVPRQQPALPTPKPQRRLTPLGRQHALLHRSLSCTHTQHQHWEA